MPGERSRRSDGVRCKMVAELAESDPRKQSNAVPSLVTWRIFQWRTALTFARSRQSHVERVPTIAGTYTLCRPPEVLGVTWTAHALGIGPACARSREIMGE